jgi:hypothetical protein
LVKVSLGFLVVKIVAIGLLLFLKGAPVMKIMMIKNIVMIVIFLLSFAIFIALEVIIQTFHSSKYLTSSIIMY